jgi:hypothetical protein
MQEGKRNVNFAFRGDHERFAKIFVDAFRI